MSCAEIQLGDLLGLGMQRKGPCSWMIVCVQVGGGRLLFATQHPQHNLFSLCECAHDRQVLNFLLKSFLHRVQVHATQFHPEKSGAAGLDILRAFLDASEADLAPEPALPSSNGARHLL